MTYRLSIKCPNNPLKNTKASITQLLYTLKYITSPIEICEHLSVLFAVCSY